MTEEDLLQEAAEVPLNDLYDHEVAYYYEEARRKATAKHMKETG